VLGEPVQLAVRGLGLAQRLAEGGREVAQHGDLGPAWCGVPAWFVFYFFFYAERSGLIRPGHRCFILGRYRLGGRVLRLTDHVLDLVGADPGPRDDADRGPLRPPVDGDDGELARTGHAIGGERVARPPQVRAGGLLGDHHAVVGPAGGQRPLDGFGRL
jgi:hypothetical protein